MSEPFGIPNSWVPSLDGSDELRLQGQAADVQYKQSLTQESQMRARSQGMALKAQQQYLEKMSHQTGKAVEGADSMESQMLQDAEMERAMGHFDKAARVDREIASIRNAKKQQEAAQARIKETQSQHEVAKAKDIAEIFSGVNGPQDWPTAMMLLRSRYPDEKIPSWAEQYNPQTVEMMKRITKNGAQEAREKAQQEHEDRMDTRQQKTLTEMNKRTLEVQDRIDARHQETERRLEANRKAGAPTNAKEPSHDLIKDLDAMIHKDYPKLPPDFQLGKGDEVSSAAYEMAADVMALRNTNKGITPSEAKAQVYDRYRKSGAFVTEESEGFSIGGHKFHQTRTDTYVPKTKPAIPLPKDKSELKATELYDPGDGSKWRYNPSTKTMVEVK